MTSTLLKISENTSMPMQQEVAFTSALKPVKKINVCGLLFTGDDVTKEWRFCSAFVLKSWMKSDIICEFGSVFVLGMFSPWVTASLSGAEFSLYLLMLKTCLLLNGPTVASTLVTVCVSCCLLTHSLTTFKMYITLNYWLKPNVGFNNADAPI